jgi:hypothetical protein
MLSKSIQVKINEGEIPLLPSELCGWPDFSHHITVENCPPPRCLYESGVKLVGQPVPTVKILANHFPLDNPQLNIITFRVYG